MLQNLLILDGERLSYRTLDVEQIGSVYETVMGFNLRVTDGRSIAIKPTKAHGAPAAINLEALLAAKPADRAKWLKDQTDQTLTGQAADALKKAASLEDLLAALEKKIAWHATPSPVPKGAMVLQPSDERRRSGSHYTPRSLTEPIVLTTLRRMLEQLGPNPTPQQILELKVCDKAMGSGAFLVETDRQLGDELVRAWHFHDEMPMLPPDEDEILYARRLIAQRCLYGVDRNPMAVDLAKLSLWLATLAKDHPFTFLDHSLRAGDSIVGLSKKQIAAFHWAPNKQRDLFRSQVEERLKRVTEFRKEILAARDDVPYEHLRQQLDVADEQLSLARLAGDLVIAAYFSANKDKPREQKLDELAAKLAEYLGPPMKIDHRASLVAAVDKLRSGDRPVTPFHWEIEFPEVFSGANPGFDAIVGNPPFAGKNTLLHGNAEGYIDWLKTIHEESHGNADLVAHFFRRAFALLRHGGCFGLIATNTIGQGDTRSTGLRWICTHGGAIYHARKRLKWPGLAAVVVSVVHVCRGNTPEMCLLDGRSVDLITAYLFHAGIHETPARLVANEGKSFIGSFVLGMGFTFDDTDTSGVANSLAEMHRLIAKDRRNAKRIFPYIGGEEVNDNPKHAHHRYVINFEDWPLRREDLGVNWADLSEREKTEYRRTGFVPRDYPEPVAADYPDLLAIIEERVKPKRMQDNREGYKRYWWHYAEKRAELYPTIRGLDRVLVCPIISNKLSFVFLDAKTVFSHKLAVIPFDCHAVFAVLQSRAHEVWARLFSSTMKDDLNYSPSDCFGTFPFPSGFRVNQVMEQAGRNYYDFRAALMVRNNEGLTKTYNRFHDPNETTTDILTLRELHTAMDRAVLDAYDWHDLAHTATCEFLLDYEEEEEDGAASKKKKPWRYRWPDEFRDEVLARLLDLNKNRAEEEAISGLGLEKTPVATPSRTKPGRKAKPVDTRASDLFEPERERFYIWMLLRAWGKPVTRHALNAGLVLMLNDDVRRGLLGVNRPRKSKTPRIVQGLDYVLQEMEKLGHIAIDNTRAQQILAILPAAPSTDPAPEEDMARVREVKQFFAKEKENGNVIEDSEHIDAKQDLVST